MSKDLSTYIHPDHLPANFEITDPRNMKQEQIILFFKHIAARQQAYSGPDVFRFKTAKVGRKGNKTFHEEANRNPGEDRESTDDDHQPIFLTTANANVDHNHPQASQAVQFVHPQLTLALQHNATSKINWNGSRHPQSNPNRNLGQSAMLIVVPNIITNNLIDPVLLGGSTISQEPLGA